MAADIKANGGTAEDLAYLYGFSVRDVNAALDAHGIPHFDVGINRVPYDMDARIHQGELIVPAKFNPFNPGAATPWGKGGTGGSSAEVVAAIQALQSQQYALGRQTLEYLKTLETLARKNDALGVKTREPA